MKQKGTSTSANLFVFVKKTKLTQSDRDIAANLEGEAHGVMDSKKQEQENELPFLESDIMLICTFGNYCIKDERTKQLKKKNLFGVYRSNKYLQKN